MDADELRCRPHRTGAHRGQRAQPPLRQPAVLARAAASLDLLSGGRVELGLGAGGFWDPIVGMGGERLSPGESLRALGEAIDVIRGIWDKGNHERLVVDGTHHRVNGAKRGPAPAHDVAIWVGGLKPRMLRLIGEKADGWLPSLAYLKGMEQIDESNARIDEAASAAGRDPRQVRRLVNIGGQFTSQPSDRLLVGPPGQWAEQLATLALEHGLSAFIAVGDDPNQVGIFGQEVAPATRELVGAERATRNADGPPWCGEVISTMDLGHPLEFGTFVTPLNSQGPRSGSPQGRTTRSPPSGSRSSARRPAWTSSPSRTTPTSPAFTRRGRCSAGSGQTERIRLAPSVINVPMRQPAVLARAAASLDLLSHGRLELALGAGYFWDAMESMGIDRLARCLGRCARGGHRHHSRHLGRQPADSIAHQGTHHRVNGVDRGPAPAHNIPIWVGGGSPMLDLIGRLADGWVIPAATPVWRTCPPPAAPSTRQRSGPAATHARSGASPTSRVASQPATAASSTGLPRSGSRHLLPLVVDDGVGTFILASDDPHTIETFAGEVVPALREAVAVERAERGTETRTIASSFIRRAAARRHRLRLHPGHLGSDAVEPGDAAYARLRSNYMRGGNPGLVLRPRDPSEVAVAVKWARTQPVPLSVRSGGHGISGRSTNHGGVIIDLGHLRDIEVIDPSARRVGSGPGLGGARSRPPWGRTVGPSPPGTTESAWAAWPPREASASSGGRRA